MSRVYDEALQERLRAFCEEIGSQAKAAKALNYSPGAISAYLNGKYDSGVNEIEARLREAFRVQDERQSQPARVSPSRIEPGLYRPTSISEHIYKNIKYCQLEKGILSIVGEAGIGKTMAASKFVKDNPSTAIYMEVTPITGVLSRFIRALARKLRIQDANNLGTLLEEVKARLMGTNTVLIVDEAQHLRFAALEEIRNWTQPNPITNELGIGIVLMGNPQISLRMKGRYSDRYEQQFSRSRDIEYKRRQISREDVQLIFPALTGNGMEQETDFMLSVCRSPWAIRNATYIWNDAVNSNDTSCERLRSIAHSRNILVA